MSSSSLKCFEALLICQQVALLISSGGVWLIYLEVIALTTYLGNWALKAPITAFGFLLDFHMLLLEAIGASSLRPCPFQVHLKST